MLGPTVQVALKDATLAFDKLYTYAVPPELHSKAEAGKRVLVPFGKGNIKKQGMIFSIEQKELKGLKNILAVTDEKSVLSKELLLLCEYMKETLFCSYYDAVNAMLPPGLGLKLISFYSANPEFSVSLLEDTEKQVYQYLEKTGEKAEEKLINELGITKELLEGLVLKEALIKNFDTKQKIGDKQAKWVKLAEGYEGAKITPRQLEVVSLLAGIGEASVKEICYFTGVTASVIETLIKNGVLIAFEKQVFRTPIRMKTVKNSSKIVLTDEQQKAYEGLLGDFRAESGKVSLLYGITGSGKTQVFLSLADEVIAEGRGVIVMVPEIALTPQLISIFTARYGDKIAVFHSAMSMGQRMDEWKRIKEGKALIAIGTRTAVFAPFDNLGLIIVDEEQEHTYKSEKSPRFSTREIARFRVMKNKGLLCLASATPSLESYTAAKKGKYSLYKLTTRYGNAVLPEVITVDMREELRNGNSGVLSNILYEEINNELENKKQAIILLNRRGHNTYVSCPSCGYVAACPNCSVSLTYHSANNRLMCHYCGYSEKVGERCPECENEHMKFMGLGTQKAEEELRLLFPNARVLRLDADSTVSRDSYATYLEAFSNGEYDILLGTQMVAKGLDFPNVTVVGVLGADKASYSEDFKSFERTFSLLTQVIGRAGRGENKGKAIVQTMNTDSNLLEMAEKQDFDAFYEEEILTRKLMIYPPYCDICLVSAQSLDRNIAEETISEVFGNIKKLIETKYSDVKVIILGPAAASMAKVNNRYRYRMIIKCRNNAEFREMLRKAIDIKLAKDASVWVDMNPENIG